MEDMGGHGTFLSFIYASNKCRFYKSIILQLLKQELVFNYIRQKPGCFHAFIPDASRHSTSDACYIPWQACVPHGSPTHSVTSLAWNLPCSEATWVGPDGANGSKAEQTTNVDQRTFQRDSKEMQQ